MSIEQKIKIQRIAGASLFVLSTIITILFFSLADPLNYRFFYQAIQVTLLGWLSLCYFIGTLLLLVKHYRYSDKEITIYAGWFYNYLKIDGEVLDEHNTFVTFTAIVLSCTLDDGTRLQATISLTNRIALKINDRLYKNK